MHILHKILVCINGYSPVISADREDLINEVRHRAEAMTDEYCGEAFDWRETDTAGRWSDAYPVNVILSRDNIDRFVDELKGCIELQMSEMQHHLDNICKISSDIKTLFDIERSSPGSVPSWDLRCLSELMCGVYNCDSGFYNTEEYTAKITELTIETIKSSPDDWALAMFDYHY